MQCDHARTGSLTGHQKELVNLGAVEAVQRLCSGEIKAVEYAEALLEQNNINACLNNFAALEPQQVIYVQWHHQAQ